MRTSFDPIMPPCGCRFEKKQETGSPNDLITEFSQRIITYGYTAERRKLDAGEDDPIYKAYRDMENDTAALVEQLKSKKKTKVVATYRNPDCSVRHEYDT